MTVQNLLLLDEQQATTSISLWEPTVLGDCEVKRSIVNFRSEPASLLVTSLTDNEMCIRLVRTLPISSSTRYRAFCSAYSETSEHQFGIRVLLYNALGSVVATHYSSEKAASNRWNVASVDFVTPNDAKYASVRLFSSPYTISLETGEKSYHRNMWFDDIVMAQWTDYPSNDFLALVEQGIPAYMLDIDDDDEMKPLRRYLDVMTSTADEILSAVKAFDYIPAVDGVPGYNRSTLVDPSYYVDDVVAKKRWLPWLAQLVGVRGIASGTSGQTPFFWIEETYRSWLSAQTGIDPEVNNAWSITSFSRSSNTVTATLGTQTSGSTVYFPVAGDVVDVTHVGTFSGSFTVLTSSSPTVTWAQTGANQSSSVAGSLLISDTSWSELESDNPLAFSSSDVLAQLTRTRATGLHAGTKASIQAAVRSVIDGYDSKGTVAWLSPGNVLVTTAEPHSLSVGSFVEVYSSGNAEWNRNYTVATVVGSRSFTVSAPGSQDKGYGTIPCWVTNKRVDVVTTTWTMKVKTLESQTFAIDLVLKAVDLSKPAGMVATHEYTT
jgi:hypothetical protein